MESEAAKHPCSGIISEQTCFTNYPTGPEEEQTVAGLTCAAARRGARALLRLDSPGRGGRRRTRRVRPLGRLRLRGRRPGQPPAVRKLGAVDTAPSLESPGSSGKQGSERDML